MPRWKPLTAALIGGAIALAGCGSSTKHTSTPPPKIGTPGAATTVPSNLTNNVDQRKQVSIGSCASAPGGWGAVGTAHNPGKSAVTYRITVFFTTSGATVEGYGQTSVTVPAGKSASWKTQATIAKPDAQSQCVLRAVS